jgi:hypothetical protein
MTLRELSFVSQEPIASLPFIRYRIKLKQAVEVSEQAREIGKEEVDKYSNPKRGWMGMGKQS